MRSALYWQSDDRVFTSGGYLSPSNPQAPGGCVRIEVREKVTLGFRTAITTITLTGVASEQTTTTGYHQSKLSRCFVCFGASQSDADRPRL
jgi:hypothetical protein